MITYEELIRLESFEDRLEALILNDYNYNSPRGLMQAFYRSHAWLGTRKTIISRDLGCDLGVIGLIISGKIIVHHIDPITPEDFYSNHPKLLDPSNLICVSVETHNIIHYGQPPERYEERQPNDTIFWERLS